MSIGGTKMNKDAYYDWIAENDTYPEHSHQFFVSVYTKYEGIEAIHRYFGTFPTRKEAKIFAADYRDKYTKPGFITMTRIFAMCEVL
jgi:hypothetical protein